MREKGRLTHPSGTDASPFEEDAEPRVRGWGYRAAAAAGGGRPRTPGAEGGGVAAGLLLLPSPLPPPRQPSQLRTAHFPALRTPAVFVQGTRDPFGSMEEMQAALKLIPARTLLLPFEGAGHDLSFGRKAQRSADSAAEISGRVLSAFRELFGQAGS